MKLKLNASVKGRVWFRSLRNASFALLGLYKLLYLEINRQTLCMRLAAVLHFSSNCGGLSFKIVQAL